MKSWVKKLPKSQVELTVETQKADVAAAEEKALRKAANHVDTPGFRPGKAPLNLIRSRLKQEFFRQQTIEVLTTQIYHAAVEQEKLKPLAEPKVEVENQKEISDWLAGLPAQAGKIEEVLPKFKFILTVWPKVELGDYKKALKELKSGKKIETAKTLSEAERKASREKKEQTKRAEKLAKLSPQEQEEELEEKIFATLLATAEMEIPDILIENETEGRLLPERKKQIERLGLTLENYLKVQKGKTLEEYKRKLRQEAKRIIKLRLILEKIAAQEELPLEKEEDVRYIMERLKKIAGS